jgi:hypothetical protein
MVPWAVTTPIYTLPEIPIPTLLHLQISLFSMVTLFYGNTQLFQGRYVVTKETVAELKI